MTMTCSPEDVTDESCVFDRQDGRTRSTTSLFSSVCPTAKRHSATTSECRESSRVGTAIPRCHRARLERLRAPANYRALSITRSSGKFARPHRPRDANSARWVRERPRGGPTKPQKKGGAEAPPVRLLLRIDYGAIGGGGVRGDVARVLVDVRCRRSCDSTPPTFPLLNVHRREADDRQAVERRRGRDEVEPRRSRSNVVEPPPSWCAAALYGTDRRRGSAGSSSRPSRSRSRLEVRDVLRAEHVACC